MYFARLSRENDCLFWQSFRKQTDFWKLLTSLNRQKTIWLITFGFTVWQVQERERIRQEELEYLRQRYGLNYSACVSIRFWKAREKLKNEKQKGKKKTFIDNVWTTCVNVYAIRSYIVSKFFTHVKNCASVEIQHKERLFHWNRTCTEIFVKLCLLTVYVKETWILK